MRRLILRLLGVDLVKQDEIRRFNDFKQREADITELHVLEKRILEIMRLHKDDILFILRTYTGYGFPVARYMELSDKLGASDELVYKQLKQEQPHAQYPTHR